ncbi:unnamed protein product, partial [Prorocentrum cordatum]
VEVVQQERNVSGAEKRRRVLWKPFSVWKKDELKQRPELGERDLITNWRKALLNADITHKFGNEWHIGEYIGIVDDDVQGSFSEVGVRSTTMTEGSDELAEATAMATSVHLRATQERSANGPSVVLASSSSSAGPAIAPQCVSNIMEVDDRLGSSEAGIAAITDRFAAQERAQKELEALHMEELVEADKFDAPAHESSSAQNQDLNIYDLEIEHRKWASKLGIAADGAGPECESIVDHAKDVMFKGAEMPADFKLALDAVTAASKDMDDARMILIKKLSDHLAEVSAEMRSDSPINLADAKGAFATMREEFLGPQGQVASLRKRLTAIRQLVQKHHNGAMKASKAENARAKMNVSAEVVNQGGAGTAMSYMYNTVWVSHERKDSGLLEATAKFRDSEGCVKYTTSEQTVNNIDDNKSFQSFLTWFADLAQKSSKPSTTAVISNPSVTKFLRTTLKDTTPMKLDLFQRPVFHDKEYNDMITALFDMSHWSHCEGYLNVAPAAHGLAEVRPGDIVCLPAGFILSVSSPERTAGLKWALPPKSESETDQVRAVSSALLDAFPALRGARYGLWQKYLQSIPA